MTIIVILFSILFLITILLWIHDGSRQEMFGIPRHPMDFVTIVFNDPVEINLLKIQAISFCFLPEDMVHRILLCWNDTGSCQEEIIKYYPKKHRSKVQWIHSGDITGERGWRNQQICKLMISHTIETTYYIVLDCKNNFIRNISFLDFFSNEGKPKLFTGNQGIMTSYLDWCCRYFQLDHDSTSLPKFSTVTPFVFQTEHVLKMIRFLEHREKCSFPEVFFKLQGTEFFLYITFLVSQDLIVHYEETPKHFITVFGDGDKWWNQWDYIDRELSSGNLSMLGIHRNVLYNMDQEFLDNMLSFYKTIYPSKKVKVVQRLLHPPYTR